MVLNVFDPFRNLDLVFDELLRNRPSAPVPSARRRQLELTRHEEFFELTAVVPGLSESDLKLTAGEDYVEIEANRSLEAPEGFTAVRRERPDFSLSRRIRLPGKVDPSKVEASLKDGLLSVKLPHKAAVEPRHVEIVVAA